MTGGANRVLPLLWWPTRRGRFGRAGKWEGAMTCNLAVWRTDFDRVDGFDEAFVGWGHEDADLVVRLIRAGVRRKDGRFAVPVIHLWHPQADRERLRGNVDRLAETIASDHVRAARGLSGHI
jgi:GT2 family glycosyltransferase